jgi:hypothetical protein
MIGTSQVEQADSRHLIVVLIAVIVIGTGGFIAYSAGWDSKDATSTETVQYTVATTSDAARLIELGPATIADEDIAVNSVYRTTTRRGPLTKIRITATVETADGTVHVEDAPYQIGETVHLSGPLYRIPVTVSELAYSDEFNTSVQAVTVAANVQSNVAEGLEEGDSQRVFGNEIASIESVERRAGDENRTHLRLKMLLRVRMEDGTPRYGGKVLRPGRDILVETDDYEIDGEVVELGNRSRVGEYR